MSIIREGMVADSVLDEDGGAALGINIVRMEINFFSLSNNAIHSLGFSS
jgi:hypothetical protein